ncbi:MAG: 3'(2'),5'-bisphosphate nucleotidase CysQ [Cytophagales bacterium]|nr:3'(2'),5'-bisphosphate nucleotidase CysQ [Cytophagales bacterium]
MSENIHLQDLLALSEKAARAAGVDILEIYESGDFSVEAKADNSPLTLADKASHNRIVSFLEKTNIPILSEEGRSIPFDERKNWEYFWMIDPLDGTKEFIKKNGEFTVNIALIHKGHPILGVVYPPVLDQMYTAIQGSGSLLDGKPIRVSGKTLDAANLRTVASRSHMSPETEEFLARLDHPEIVSKGSSLKLLMVASGEADVYPRFGPTMEWDTAAAHVIVVEAGGQVVHTNLGSSIKYNKENLLNPYFIVLGYNSVI